MQQKILVISDNAFLITAFHGLISPFKNVAVTYCCSPSNTALLNDTSLPVKIVPINIKEGWEPVAKNYDLIFSLHCKQLFPAELVKRAKCINVHPGYNPYNRGWFPQVFSILNKLPVGATIHEIDEQLDHGAIIAQKEVKTELQDTSLDIYDKVQLAEVELLKENLANILTGNYKTFLPQKEGNVNLKKDFNALCKLNLDEKMTMGEAIDKLRALTHGEYKNAWFEDPQTGKKIYISVKFETKEK